MTERSELLDELRAVVGTRHVLTDRDVLDACGADCTGRWQGRAAALLRPGTAGEIADILRACQRAGVPVTVQGGRTSLVAGTVPEHDDILLSTVRLTGLGPVDTRRRRVRIGAGATLEALQGHVAAAGMAFGVDIGSRGSATIGGMTATNAGGLRTVRYGDMSRQVTGIEVVLPDGRVVRRMSEVHSDNTGYDLAALWVGSEGTLGVITEVEVTVHPVPTQQTTAILGFTNLDDLMATRNRLVDADGLAALELLDGRGVALAVDRLGITAPTTHLLPWYLLVELAGPRDQLAELADLLESCPLADEPAVGVDRPGRDRLWATRESFAEVVGLFGPPVKVDLSVPLDRLAGFADDATELVLSLAPQAKCVLFGHVGEGNLHLNILDCPDASAVYAPLMKLIDRAGGNVSSEHGVGSLKRDYLGMTRTANDIAAMRTIKDTFDPDGLLNPAVLFG